jgi:hypothetical protein
LVSLVPPDELVPPEELVPLDELPLLESSLVPELVPLGDSLPPVAVPGLLNPK